MPANAMTLSSDSQNPAAPLTCSPDERPPVLLTPAGLQELRDNKRTLAIKQPFDDEYECPYCFSPCPRDFCWACKSELLEDEL